MDQLIVFVQYLAIVSVAAERATDLLKRSYLADKKVNGAVYQVISFAFGFVIALTQPPSGGLFNFDPYVLAAITGLAVSGGSSLWHEALTALSGISDTMKMNAELKKLDVKSQQ